jgi:hypothetical protein
LEKTVILKFGDIQGGESTLREGNINSSLRLGTVIEELNGVRDERVDVGSQFGLECCDIGGTEEENNCFIFIMLKFQKRQNAIRRLKEPNKFRDS